MKKILSMLLLICVLNYVTCVKEIDINDNNIKSNAIEIYKYDGPYN